MSGEAGRGSFVWRQRSSPESPVSVKRECHFSQRRSHARTCAPTPSTGLTAGGEMFSQTMVAAIDAARTLTQLDHLSTDIWRAWGAGSRPGGPSGLL